MVQSCCVVIWWWFQRFSALRRLLFQPEILQEDLGPFPSVFLSFCAVPGRDSVFTEEGLFGGFSEVEHLLHGFWVLSGGLSTDSLPIFSSFQ